MYSLSNLASSLSTQWKQNNNGQTLFTRSNVGIGTSTPSCQLEVAGTTKFGSNLSAPGPYTSLVVTNGGDSALGIRPDSTVYLSAVAPYILSSPDNSALPGTGSNARDMYLYGSNITYDAAWGSHQFRGGTIKTTSHLVKQTDTDTDGVLVYCGLNQNNNRQIRFSDSKLIAPSSTQPCARIGLYGNTVYYDAISTDGQNHMRADFGNSGAGARMTGFLMCASNVFPQTDTVYTLGMPGYRWNNAYIRDTTSTYLSAAGGTNMSLYIRNGGNSALGVRADDTVYLSAVAPYIDSSPDNTAVPGTGSNARNMYLYGSNITYSARWGSHSFVEKVSIGSNLEVSSTVRVNGNNNNFNKLLTLWDGGVNDPIATATNFYGFGINNSTLRYQTNDIGWHVFYAGSNQLLAASVNGVSVAGNTLIDTSAIRTLAGSMYVSSEFDLCLMSDNNANNGGANIRFGWGSSNTAPANSWGVWNATGLGIGNASPAYKLDVSGNIRATGFLYANGNVHTFGSSNAGTSLYMLDVANAAWQITTAGYNLSFANNNGGSYNNKMYITNSGNLYVSGTILGTTLQVTGAKNFKIDHPVLADKKLVHASIEGPRCDLVYRGSVKLQNGTSTIDIERDCVSNPECAMSPGTFDALCRNVAFYLQNQDSFDRVRGSVSGATLTIVCENEQSCDTVYWMVVGERNDYAIRHSDTTNSDGYLVTETNE